MKVNNSGFSSFPLFLALWLLNQIQIYKSEQCYVLVYSYFEYYCIVCKWIPNVEISSTLPATISDLNTFQHITNDQPPQVCQASLKEITIVRDLSGTLLIPCDLLNKVDKTRRRMSPQIVLA